MNRIARRTAGAGLVTATAALGLLAAAGCQGQGDAPARPLTADSFVRNRPAANVGNPIDKPGPLLYDTVHVGLLPGEKDAPDSVREVPPSVKQAVRPVSEGPTTSPVAAATPPAARLPSPATAPAGGAGAGTYVNLGAVLMEVNGRPIFTDRVLRDLEKPLSIEAKQRSPARFRQLAEDLLGKQIASYENNEVLQAAAAQVLDTQEKAVARALTAQWRQREITAAGGSLELAKQRWADQGWPDFEEKVEDQYHFFQVQLYYTKRILPQAQVTVQDLRNYYNAHRESEFTTQGAARIRVIKIDPRKYVGLRDEAYAKAQTVRQRAKGEDFEQLAKTMNDDRLLASTGGYAVGDGWLSEGAYAIEEVDKAVFGGLHAGDVSDILSGKDGNLYVVKVEELRQKGVKPFEAGEVQEAIRQTLRAAQIRYLGDKHIAELRKNAITSRNDRAISDALDIIMQRYPQWSAK